MEKRDFLFKFVDEQIRGKLILDSEALFSTTDQITADKITTDILRFVPKTAVITDATACAGGNTYSFAQHFDVVNAFERDALRVRILRHNMKLLGANNVVIRHGDSWDLCITHVQDVIFLDPPWGGPDYKKHARVSLFMTGRPLAEFCRAVAMAGTARFVALKAPTNFDETEFVANTHTFMTLRHKNTQLRKMYFYVFEVTIGQ
jgi:16S rRNA G966 N2-methylase RsmD